jgi:hypothetical protein
MPKEVEAMRYALKKDSETIVEFSIGAHWDDLREGDLREREEENGKVGKAWKEIGAFRKTVSG